MLLSDQRERKALAEDCSFTADWQASQHVVDGCGVEALHDIGDEVMPMKGKAEK